MKCVLILKTQDVFENMSNDNIDVDPVAAKRYKFGDHKFDTRCELNLVRERLHKCGMLWGICNL